MSLYIIIGIKSKEPLKHLAFKEYNAKLLLIDTNTKQNIVRDVNEDINDYQFYFIVDDDGRSSEKIVNNLFHYYTRWMKKTKNCLLLDLLNLLKPKLKSFFIIIEYSGEEIKYWKKRRIKFEDLKNTLAKDFGINTTKSYNILDDLGAYFYFIENDQ